MLHLYSYGAKNNHTEQEDVDTIYSCHHIVNPHSQHDLKFLTGLDENVQKVVWSDPKAKTLYERALLAVHEGARSLAFECYGGRHRSVAMVEIISEALRDLGYKVNINHLSLGVSYEAR